MNESTPNDISDLSPEFLKQLKIVLTLPDDNEAKVMLKRILLDNPSRQEKKKRERAGQQYYREDYAKTMIPILERMDRDKKSIQIDMKRYPGYSVNTVSQRLWQSLAYLIDHMDDITKRYERIRKTFEIRTKGHCLILFWIGIPDVTIDFEFEDYKEGPSFVDIRKEVENFIENGKNGEKMEIPRKAAGNISGFEAFVLSDDEEKMLIELCEPCEQYGMFHKIDKEKIVLIKQSVVK